MQGQSLFPNHPLVLMLENSSKAMVADPIIERMSRKQLEDSIRYTTEKMKEAARDMDYLQAAQYRDEIVKLQERLAELPN